MNHSQSPLREGTGVQGVSHEGHGDGSLSPSSEPYSFSAFDSIPAASSTLEGQEGASIPSSYPATAYSSPQAAWFSGTSLLPISPQQSSGWVLDDPASTGIESVESYEAPPYNLITTRVNRGGHQTRGYFASGQTQTSGVPEEDMDREFRRLDNNNNNRGLQERDLRDGYYREGRYYPGSFFANWEQLPKDHPRPLYNFSSTPVYPTGSSASRYSSQRNWDAPYQRDTESFERPESGLATEKFERLDEYGPGTSSYFHSPPAPRRPIRIQRDPDMPSLIKSLQKTHIDAGSIKNKDDHCHLQIHCLLVSGLEPPPGVPGLPDTNLERLKEQTISRVTKDITRWLRSKLWFSQLRNPPKRTVGEGAGSNSAGNSTSDKFGGSWSNSAGPASAGVGPGERIRCSKRKASDRQEEGESDEEEPARSKQRSAKGKAVESIKFACPYLKYNKAKYKSWRGCPGPGWPDVHRVKEHLYRRHRQPKYRCARCWQPFEDERTHTEHQRNAESCRLKPIEPVEGFDAGQEARLKSRKKAITDLGEVDKWKVVFRILFPHVDESDIPSPFYEYEEESAPNSLSECEEYVLKEVPLRLRRILASEFDRDLSIVEEGLKRKAIESIKPLLVEVFREFRQLNQKTEAGTRKPSFSGPSTQAAAEGQAACYNQAVGPKTDVASPTTVTARLIDGSQCWEPRIKDQSTDPQPPNPTLDGVELDMVDFNLEFLSNPPDILGEGLSLEDLLQPFDVSSQGGDEKKIVGFGIRL